MIEITKQIVSIAQSPNSLGVVALIALAAFALVGLALLVVRDAIKKRKD